MTFTTPKVITPHFSDGSIHQRNVSREDSINTLRTKVGEILDNICSQHNPCATIHIVNINEPLLSPEGNYLQETSINIDQHNLTIKENSFGPLYERDNYSLRKLVNRFSESLNQSLKQIESDELSHDEESKKFENREHQVTTRIIF